MQKILDTTGSDSGSSSPWEVANPSGVAGANEGTHKNLIRQANTLSLSSLFKYYGLNLNEHTRKITCPFKSHNGGREKTASFLYYPANNTFWCFGCKIGNRPCDFVSQMEGIEREEAALKIINIFKGDCDDFISIEDDFYADKIVLMTNFSNFVREKIQQHNSSEYLDYIENLCKAYDSLNEKYNLNCDALTSIIEKLSLKIENYDKKD